MEAVSSTHTLIPCPSRSRAFLKLSSGSAKSNLTMSNNLTPDPAATPVEALTSSLYFVFLERPFNTLPLHRRLQAGQGPISVKIDELLSLFFEFASISPMQLPVAKLLEPCFESICINVLDVRTHEEMEARCASIPLKLNLQPRHTLNSYIVINFHWHDLGSNK